MSGVFSLSRSLPVSLSLSLFLKSFYFFTFQMLNPHPYPPPRVLHFIIPHLWLWDGAPLSLLPICSQPSLLHSSWHYTPIPYSPYLGHQWSTDQADPLPLKPDKATMCQEIWSIICMLLGWWFSLCVRVSWQCWAFYGVTIPFDSSYLPLALQ